MIHEDDVENSISADIYGFLAVCNRRYLHSVSSEDALCYDEVHGFVIYYKGSYAVAAELLGAFFLAVDGGVEDGNDREAVERLFEDLDPGILRQDDAFVCDYGYYHFFREILDEIYVIVIFLFSDEQVCQMHGTVKEFQVLRIINAVHLDSQALNDI